MRTLLVPPPLTVSLAAFAAISLAGTLPAAAQTRNPVFSADQEACFGHVYDRNHLASHPRQKATSLHIYRALGRRSEAENWFPNEREGDIKRFKESGEASVYAFVNFRDRKGNYYNSLTCSKEERDGVFCAVECDGGSFKLRRESANAMLLTNSGFVDSRRRSRRVGRGRSGAAPHPRACAPDAADRPRPTRRD